jgi:serine/threonine protein kinase
MYGVERDPDWDGGFGYLVWEYVIGEPIDEWIVRGDVKPRDVLLVVRELLLAIDALHARGIVHGAVHARNVIVDSSGLVRLTHVSPLLYTDVRNDLAAIAILLNDLAELRADVAEPLIQLTEAAAYPQATLRSLAAHAVLKPDASEEPNAPIEPSVDQTRRRRMRLNALGVVVIALALTYEIKRFAAARWNSAPPSPPVAPASALRP